MIRMGSITDTAAPELPAVLPGLAGLNLLSALADQERRLRFMAEHLAHPAVLEGVADAVHDAHAAVQEAQKLQADLVWGSGA